MSSTPLDRLDRRMSKRPVSSFTKQKNNISTYSTGSGNQWASSDYTDFTANNPDEYLLQDRVGAATTPHNPTSNFKFVRWGVAWQVPTFMVACTVGGLALAFGHHFYYQSLSGTVAGSSGRQQWALKLGTAFSVLVLVLFKSACGTAYNQYVWTLFKRRAYSLDTLDRLFALTIDPVGFASWEVLSHGRLAVLLALTSWFVSQPSLVHTRS